MPRRNQIELQGLAERVLEMHLEKKLSISDIAEQLRSEGFDVSRSGVGRTVHKGVRLKKEYEAAAKEVTELVKSLQNVPGIDVMEVAGQLVQIKLFEEFKQIDSFSELTTEELVILWTKVSRTQIALAKVKLAFAKGYKEGVLKASQMMEESAVKAGWSEESVQVIRRKLLNLQPPEDGFK